MTPSQLVATDRHLQDNYTCHDVALQAPSSLMDFVARCKGRKDLYEDFLRHLLFLYSSERPCAVLDLKNNFYLCAPERRCRACALVKGETEQGEFFCKDSDFHAARLCYMTGASAMFQCSSLGLLDFVVPIKATINGKPEVVSVVLFGQYRTSWLSFLSEEKIQDYYKRSEEICDALQDAPWLEGEVESIGIRLRRVDEFIREETENRCSIQTMDLDATTLLAEREIDPRNSVARLHALRRFKTVDNGVATRSCGAGSLLESKNGISPVTVWPWTDNLSRLPGSFAFLRCALPTESRSNEDQSVIEWIKEHAKNLQSLGFETSIPHSKKGGPYGRLWDCLLPPRYRHQSRFLSGDVSKLRNAEFLNEASFKTQPTNENLDEWKVVAAQGKNLYESMEQLTFAGEGEKFYIWNELLKQINSAKHNPESLSLSFTSETADSLLNSKLVPEWKKSIVALIKGAILSKARSNPNQKIPPSAVDGLMASLCRLSANPSLPGRETEALKDFLKRLRIDFFEPVEFTLIKG